MRNVISKLIAAAALVTVSAAPAMACGGGGLFGGGCSPCGQAYVSPCGNAGYSGGYGYAGVAGYERLPDPSRYYYVNQGPSFSGPGNYAPYPTYQETAISGPRGYDRPNYGYYDGGPYGNATNHYSYAQPAYRAPIVYSYQPRVRPSYRYGYRMQPRVHYGYYHQRRHFAGPRLSYGPRYAPRHGYPHYQQRAQRRMY